MFLHYFFIKFIWTVCFRSTFDGHDEDGSPELQDISSDGIKDGKIIPHQIPVWLSESTPDEFVVRIVYSMLCITDCISIYSYDFSSSSLKCSNSLLNLGNSEKEWCSASCEVFTDHGGVPLHAWQGCSRWCHDMVGFCFAASAWKTCLFSSYIT